MREQLSKTTKIGLNLGSLVLKICYFRHFCIKTDYFLKIKLTRRWATRSVWAKWPRAQRTRWRRARESHSQWTFYSLRSVRICLTSVKGPSSTRITLKQRSGDTSKKNKKKTKRERVVRKQRNNRSIGVVVYFNMWAVSRNWIVDWIA